MTLSNQSRILLTSPITTDVTRLSLSLSLSLSLHNNCAAAVCTTLFSFGSNHEVVQSTSRTRNKEGDVMVVVLILLLLFPLLHSIQTPHHFARQCLSPSSFLWGRIARHWLQDEQHFFFLTSVSLSQFLQEKTTTLSSSSYKNDQDLWKHAAKWRKTKNTHTHTHTEMYFFHYKLHKSGQKVHSRMSVNQGGEIHRVSDLCS